MTVKSTTEKKVERRRHRAMPRAEQPAVGNSPELAELARQWVRQEAEKKRREARTDDRPARRVRFDLD